MSLPNRTFYQPLQSGLRRGSSELKLPVILWGNGNCDPWGQANMQQCVPSKFDYIKWCLSKTECADNYESVGLKFRNLLGEVSSWGALAIATGPAFVDPVGYEEPPVDLASVDSKLNPNALTEAIDWVYENAGKGDWKHIDRSRIGVWGQSCGGLEAYLAGGQDDRVGHLGIFNSGQLTVNASEAIVGKITKPIFYILGGPTDMAYVSGEQDYANLPRKTPAWKGSHNLGHSAAFDVPNSGIPGVTGRHILQWLLRGDARAKAWFISNEAKDAGFINVTYQNLDHVKVHPIQ